jgi:hypothetical protein
MTPTDRLLWQAQDQDRNWRRWILRAAVTALVAVGGLLAAVAGWPVHGSVVAGSAVLVALLGLGLLTRVSPYDPDIAFRSYRTTLTLELRGGRSYRCRRISEFTTTGPVEGAKEHWQSLFPAARVISEVRFGSSGTGD